MLIRVMKTRTRIRRLGFKSPVYNVKWYKNSIINGGSLRLTLTGRANIPVRFEQTENISGGQECPPSPRQ